MLRGSRARAEPRIVREIDEQPRAEPRLRAHELGEDALEADHRSDVAEPGREPRPRLAVREEPDVLETAAQELDRAQREVFRKRQQMGFVVATGDRTVAI